MQVIVTTSDKSLNVLKGFAHLFNKYWGESQPVTIAGFTPPDFDLPPNFNFTSVGKFADYPADKWSDYFRVVLKDIAEDVFLLLLDDYWITRKVDVRGMRMMYDYMHQFQNVIKFDVTRDRLYSDTGRYLFDYHTYAHLGYLDLIKSPPGSQYHMSLWGGLWRRDLLLDFIPTGKTAQQIELEGTPMLSQMGDEVLVLGSRQAPLLHGNILQSGHPDKAVFADGGWQIAPADLEAMRTLGYLENLR